MQDEKLGEQMQLPYVFTDEQLASITSDTVIHGIWVDKVILHLLWQARNMVEELRKELAEIKAKVV